MTIKEFLNFFEFDLEKYGTTYGVVDLQGANLGDIEDERYDTVQEIVERFNGSVYIPDYITDHIEEDADKEFDSYEEMYQWCNDHGDTYFKDVLYALIHPDSVTIE